MESLAHNLRSALRSVLCGTPPPVWGATPCPWLAWLLICLLRQIPRQMWLLEVVRSRLQDVGPPQGPVPGLPGWTYDFHGMGCCLSGPGGENVDVDFHPDPGVTIDPGFFAQRVLALHAPPLPEARLAAFLPSDALVERAIQDLSRLGLVIHPRGTQVFRLAPALEGLAEKAARAMDWPEAEGIRWARALGDGELWARLDPQTADPDLVRHAREGLQRWLLSVLDDPYMGSYAVKPLLALLGPKEVAPLASRVLSGPITSLCGHLIRSLPQEFDGSTAVAALARRLSPAAHPPFVACEAARYLLERGVERTLALSLLRGFGHLEKVEGFTGNPHGAQLALLALEQAPSLALDLVRRALRDPSPSTRATLAAACVLLDRAWCRRELVDALLSEPERGAGIPLATALLALPWPEGRRVVERWSMEHPPVSHQGPGYTLAEQVEANARAFQDWEVEKLRPWALRFGPRVPEDLPLPTE